MTVDQGLLGRCLDVLASARSGAIRHKNVFGMRGLLRDSRMFAAVGDTSIIVKCSPAEYEAALRQSGVRPFAPGGQKLGTWVEIDEDVLADDPELRTWLDLGLRALR